jgi:tetratricopeptide (TPR) repeat protein
MRILDRDTYLKGLQEQFPDVKPYGEDDWDWTWADDGYQFLEACDFGMAELTFQRLIVARPQDPDGYEGLALVYQALGIREQALALIDEAVRLAGIHVDEDRLDPEALEEICEEQLRIQEMPDRPESAAQMDSDDDDDDSDDDEEAGW